MGLSIDSVRFLVLAWKAGARFGDVLTLGRQHVAVSPERIESILEAQGCWPPPGGAAEFRRSLQAPASRFETFARALGAKTIHSCDASAYEGATLVHDLNRPIPADWEESYDAVIDGGTLEHVFNFPVAIANCMKMVKPGGHLIVMTPANNYCGHGFYQFSPELFYRVLSRENGFQVERMVALADVDGVSSLLGVKYTFPITGPWYEVKDPAQVQSRVTLINDQAVLLYVLARKISRANLFEKFPQQSDYVGQWKAGAASHPHGQSERGQRMIGWLTKLLSESFCRETLPKLAWVLDPFRLLRFRRKNSFHNRKSYRRVGDEPG